MERAYEGSENQSNVIYFSGIEIEATPAYGMHTLFVVGIRPLDEVLEHAKNENAEHIYLGANQCFKESVSYHDLALGLLDAGYWVTLDYPLQSHEWVLWECSDLMDRDNFIPQISVKIPYISDCNYNTTIKIDDKDFRASNPGVWCHQLHDLMAREKFTSWKEYTNDKIIETENHEMANSESGRKTSQ